MGGNSLDKKDEKIIAMLKEDGRASIREISKATGIRPSTVHKRIQKLTESGVIEKFTVSLNDEAMGEGFTVHMLISGSTDRYLTDKVLKNTHLKGVYGITGEYDMLLKMKFKDLGQFNKFLIDFRETHGQDLYRTLTMVQTVNLKDE
jgi:DNA-binding Lrp family transcriptional regulator